MNENRSAPSFVSSGDLSKVLSELVRNPGMSRAEFDAVASDMSEEDREKVWTRAHEMRQPG